MSTLYSLREAEGAFKRTDAPPILGNQKLTVVNIVGIFSGETQVPTEFGRHQAQAVFWQDHLNSMRQRNRTRQGRSPDYGAQLN